MTPVEYRPGRRRVKWVAGLTFAVPLPDESFGLGQSSELMWPNVGYCALFAARIPSLETAVPHLVRKDAIALLAVARQGLTGGYWPVVASGPAFFSRADFPNERFREAGYVGAKTYDFGLAEAFLAAYHGLEPWNDWHDPAYLDTMLAPGVGRPATAQVLGDAELARYRAEKKVQGSPP